MLFSTKLTSSRPPLPHTCRSRLQVLYIGTQCYYVINASSATATSFFASTPQLQLPRMPHAPQLQLQQQQQHVSWRETSSEMSFNHVNQYEQLRCQHY